MLQTLTFEAVQALELRYQIAIILLIVPFLTYSITSIRSAIALHAKGKRKPPILPYWLPWLGNLIESRNPAKLASNITYLPPPSVSESSF